MQIKTIALLATMTTTVTGLELKKRLAANQQIGAGPGDFELKHVMPAIQQNVNANALQSCLDLTNNRIVAGGGQGPPRNTCLYHDDWQEFNDKFENNRETTGRLAAEASFLEDVYAPRHAGGAQFDILWSGRVVECSPPWQLNNCHERQDHDVCLTLNKRGQIVHLERTKITNAAGEFLPVNTVFNNNVHQKYCGGQNADRDIRKALFDYYKFQGHYLHSYPVFANVFMLDRADVPAAGNCQKILYYLFLKQSLSYNDDTKRWTRFKEFLSDSFAPNPISNLWTWLEDPQGNRAGNENGQCLPWGKIKAKLRFQERQNNGN